MPLKDPQYDIIGGRSTLSAQKPSKIGKRDGRGRFDAGYPAKQLSRTALMKTCPYASRADGEPRLPITQR